MTTLTTDTPRANQVFVDLQGNMTQDKFNQMIMEASWNFKTTMALVNNIAVTAMTDAMDVMEEAGLYKQKVKRYLNLADKVRENQERDLKHCQLYNVRLKYYSIDSVDWFSERIIGGKLITRERLFQWYHDIGQCGYRRHTRVIENLRLAILRMLTKHELEHRNEISYACLANTLLDYACYAYDKIISDYKELHHIDYNPLMHPFKYDKLFNSYNQATKALCGVLKDEEKPIDLNESEDIKKAFDAFDNAIRYDLATATSADEAIELDKDIMTKERYRKYRLAYNDGIMKRNGVLNHYEA